MAGTSEVFVVKNTFIDVAGPEVKCSQSQTLPARLPRQSRCVAVEDLQLENISLQSTTVAASSTGSEHTDEEEVDTALLGSSVRTMGDSMILGQWQYPQAIPCMHGLRFDVHDVAAHESSFIAQASPSFDEPHLDVDQTEAMKCARDNKLKLWCHFYLNEGMLEDDFHMAKKIIGKGGEHTRRIYCDTDAKVRLRGKGSGHQERDSGAEAQVPLMLAVTASPKSPPKFAQAVHMAIDLLRSVETKYQQFLMRKSRHDNGSR
eukprot:5963868-Amphidinium_carterae.1